MKLHLTSVVLLLAGLFSSPSGAVTYPLSPLLRQRVDVSLAASGTSNQLLALAKIGKVNVVADATEFPQFPHITTVEEQSNFIAAVGRVANEQKLGWRSLNERTLLFWSAPEILSLTTNLMRDPELNALIAVAPQQPAKTAGETPATQREAPEPANREQWLQGVMEGVKQRQLSDLRERFSSAPAQLRLAEFLRDQYGWDGQNPNLSVSFKWSQLPPELQTQLKPLFLWKIHSSLNADKPWFSPDLWRTARVGIKGDGSTPLISLESTLNKKQIFHATLLEPPARRTPQQQAEAEVRDQARAQAESQTLPLVKPPSQEEMTPDGLAYEARFQAPVLLQLKEQPLPQVLAQLQKQSGLSLSLTPDASASLATKSVTLGVREMPLGEVMNALARLYGAKWKVRNEGYTLSEGGLSPARQELIRAGDLDWYRFWQSVTRQQNAQARLTMEEWPNWRDEFTRLGLFEALSSPQGVAFADLPEEFQLKLRTTLLKIMSPSVIQAYSEATALEQDMTLRTGPELQRGMRKGKLVPVRLLVSAFKDDETSFSEIVLDPYYLGIGQELVAGNEAKNKAATETADAGM